MSRKRRAGQWSEPYTESSQRPTTTQGVVSNQEEVKRLQHALDQALEESRQLRQEKEQLEKKNEKLEHQAAQEKAIRDKELKRMAQLQQAKQRAQTAEHRLQNLQAKYTALSASKLGKLTLNYWAWQNQKQNAGRVGNVFLIQWLFGKLPSVQIAEPEEQTEGLPQTSSPEPSPEKEANPPEQIVAVQQATGKKEGQPTEKRQTPTEKKEVAKTASAGFSIPSEQEHWLDPYLEKIYDIPDSNGIRYYQKLNLRIGLVCDEFFYESISAAADFVFLTPENWREVLDSGLDAVLFVSAWRGLNEEWRGIATLRAVENTAHKQAIALLQDCRQRNIPTVFYSKEDPPNYELFLDYARQCDYIFTSAKECVPYYKKECDREEIEAVCFGINPLFHNPIGFYQKEKEDTVLFSGSWMRKYPKRCMELAVIFDGILQAGHGLHIIDRNYPANLNYLFPEQYLPYVSPSISHDILQKVHKLFHWAININSVKGSETMFANRAFELQANGVLLLSNFSVGINSMLPNIWMVNDKEEVSGIMGSLSEEERYERQVAGIRSVMTGHTCFDRIAQLLRPIGMKVTQPVRTILVIAETVTPQVQRSFDCQSFPTRTLVSVGQAASVLEQYDMVAWFDTTAAYDTFYLEDLANGFKYTACNYITKDAWYEGEQLHEGAEHQYVTRMRSKYRTLFWREAYPAQFLLTVTGEQSLENGYSIDHFHYNAVPVQPEEVVRDWKLSVVVPVYNNGRHLYGKCFASLRRSSMFQDMEILLVDDGSTDDLTLKIEGYLAHRYPNVRLYQFPMGGSGSASRSRNKGVELATAPYLTFLDPDNEAVCDGYAVLYEKACKDNCDIVFGNMYRCAAATQLSNNYQIVVDAAGTEFFENGFGDTLQKANFLAISIQAMVIRRALLQRNQLEEIPGAAGQDTLFSWQMLQCAQRIRGCDLPIHVYYAQTAGSVTNSVQPDFFQKMLLLQQPKAAWLNSAGLMQTFMERRYDYYTTNWVLKRLSTAAEGKEQECTKLAAQILDVFAPWYHQTDPLINAFMDLCQAGKETEAFARVREEFPMMEKRPMPTREELRRMGQRRAEIQVTYEQEGGTLTFYNETIKSGDSCAWVILLDDEEYKKIFATKYLTAKEFVYDFSQLPPGGYKLRVFLKNENRKIVSDVAYFQVDGQEVHLLEEQSSAHKKGQEAF